MKKIAVARVYEAPEPGHGARILVDRLWPRGLSKEAAALDQWCKEVAPSTGLRHWFNHDPERFEEFAARYRAELEEPERAEALDQIAAAADRGPVTLLTATKDLSLSHAPLLAELLGQTP